MNTSKKIRRHTFDQTTLKDKTSMGSYAHSLDNPEIGSLLAQAASAFVHLESTMESVLAVLLGHETPVIAGYIMRAIKSPKGRVDVMKDLLELAPSNKGLPTSFDTLISEFSAISARRNAYVHGLWYTQMGTGQAYLEESDEHGMAFLTARPVEGDELDVFIERVWTQNSEVIRFATPFLQHRQLALEVAQRGETPDWRTFHRHTQKPIDTQ